LTAILAGEYRACGRQAKIQGDKVKPEMISLNNIKIIINWIYQ
jgi:hypothetical protein